MEAMGRGLVVLATPCGGIPEMIIHGENGFLIESPQDFAATMQRLKSKPQLLHEIGHKARDRCVSAFTLERLHEGVDRVYVRAARKRAALPPARIGVNGMQEPRADLPVQAGKHPM
jgi:glycosyltransferase involved in cell wall biosynthesis